MHKLIERHNGPHYRGFSISNRQLFRSVVYGLPLLAVVLALASPSEYADPVEVEARLNETEALQRPCIKGGIATVTADDQRLTWRQLNNILHICARKTEFEKAGIELPE